jgi:hypothetical protein
MVVDPDDGRRDVARRLLARGLSPATLRALLPSWDGMITLIADPSHAAGAAAPEQTGAASSVETERGASS